MILKNWIRSHEQIITNLISFVNGQTRIAVAWELRRPLIMDVVIPIVDELTEKCNRPLTTVEDVI